LQNINLSFYPGEFVSLVGHSGAGKSTLMSLLIREDVPTKGHVFVAGRDITQLHSSDLPYYRRRIGVIFQDFKLLPYLTVQENITFALEVSEATQMEIEDRIPKILELVGLTHRRDSYPRQLSGGERQRVAVARALIHSPKVLIADEPTGNLDPENSQEVIDLFKRINQTGTLVILATHNQHIVDELNHRVVTLKGGQVLSDKNESGYKV
jgi:cell division transport system ATP-binding protein